MALKIALKPHEKLIVGGAVIRNGDAKTDLFVENDVPVLREKRIMTLERADSPCRRIYFLVQLMYIDSPGIREYHRQYWGVVREVARNAPSTMKMLDQINELVYQEKYYPALQATELLIQYEEELLYHAEQSIDGLSAGTDTTGDRS